MADVPDIDLYADDLADDFHGVFTFLPTICHSISHTILSLQIDSIFELNQLVYCQVLSGQ